MFAFSSGEEGFRRPFYSADLNKNLPCRHLRTGGNPFLRFRNGFSNQGFLSLTMDSRLSGNDDTEF
ncbi:hypothetical protein MCC93_01450 [Morococcus cerebrosus]|uniref:Uncharacterized protein n=1 Tax=Morococcus cerebrosus TaxID=1056807 RepID=A0A0C1HFZ0_9NEIS|nr:hypothetical protein MCC93_01450 [Morococcus cerebrosus]